MPRRSSSIALVLGLLTATLALTTVSAPAEPAGPMVPGTSCPAFPYDNVWNTRINKLPVHRMSATWMAAMNSASTKLHPDYGPAGAGQQPYGIPWEVVDPATPGVTFTFQWPGESNRTGYPISSSTVIEGGSDRHAIMVNPSTCRLYELFNTRYRPTGQSTASSGALFNLTSNYLRTDGWTSADAAGLPILAGLVDYDQVMSGAMNHAIRFTASCTRNQYTWPARHEAGVSNASCPPMGARFRLKAGFSLPASQCATPCQTVVTAMMRYGLILADNGSNWFFTGTSDERWTGDQVDQLKQIPASAFQAVDESCLRVNPSSARAYQPGTLKYTQHCPKP
jgi:hypothetical protein